VNAIIKFLIVAFAVFLLVKQVNRLQAHILKSREEESAPLTKDQQLLTEIRDLLGK
jgi:large conductance mechanosensitive channel